MALSSAFTYPGYPICRGKLCSPLPLVSNSADSVTNGGRYPSTGRYGCAAGFEKVGRDYTLSCQPDGSWDGGRSFAGDLLLPACRGAPCLTLSPPGIYRNMVTEPTICLRSGVSGNPDKEPGSQGESLVEALGTVTVTNGGRSVSTCTRGIASAFFLFQAVRSCCHVNALFC